MENKKSWSGLDSNDILSYFKIKMLYRIEKTEMIFPANSEDLCNFVGKTAL